jgi:hypothetical protein
MCIGKEEEQWADNRGMEVTSSEASRKGEGTNQV